MDTKTNFQLKFPLSPKKITKKMLNAIAPDIAVSLVLSVVPFLIRFSSGHQDARSILSTFLIGGLIILFICLTVSRIYWKAYIARYYYDCNEDFITIKKNVFTPTEIHIQYQKIQDVYVDQDLMDRFLGIYDVHIASATVSSGIEAHIDGVSKETAEGLKNFILHAIKNGGANTMNIPAPINISQPTAPVFENKEEISYRTYPIQSGWMVQKVLASFWHAFYTTLLLVILGGSVVNLSISMLHLELSIFGIMAIFSLVVFAGSIGFAILWRKGYKFEFLNDYIFVREGVISNQEQHIPYDRVQDVVVKQSLVQRILGIADVLVQNAAVGTTQVRPNGFGSNNGVTIPGQSVASANKIAEVLRKIILTKNQKTGL